MRQVYILAAIGILLGLLTWYVNHDAYRRGIAEQQVKDAEAFTRMQATLDAEYKKHQAELVKLNAQLAKTRRDDDAKLADALKQSPQYLDLWNTPLPAAMAGFAWGDGLHP